MTLPAFLFGFLISTMYGAVFHLIKGGGPGRLFTYVCFSWIGFWTGHLIAAHYDWMMWSIGPLRFGLATAGALIFLIFGNWISKVRVDRPAK
jgi:hypothetical protein